GRPLRAGRRQGPHSHGGEAGVEGSPDDRLSQTGPLRARRRRREISAAGRHDRARRRAGRLGSAGAARRREATEEHMKPTKRLHDAGQSLWLDNITRALLTSGELKRYVDELSVTGLTSNPTIFDHAIAHSNDYDDTIRKGSAAGRAGEDLFFDLAIEDLTRAADI